LRLANRALERITFTSEIREGWSFFKRISVSGSAGRTEPAKGASVRLESLTYELIVSKIEGGGDPQTWSVVVAADCAP
jgi:hypothetical protein